MLLFSIARSLLPFLDYISLVFLNIALDENIGKYQFLWIFSFLNKRLYLKILGRSDG